MRKVYLIVLSLALLCASAHAQSRTDQAVAYQINATHTGSIETPGLKPPLRKRWERNFGRSVSYPIIADGKVFVTVRNSANLGNGTTLYALDAKTGAYAWAPWGLGGNYSWSGLCYENGRLFALSADGVMRAFDAATGDMLWQQRVTTSADSPPTVYKGVVYAAGSGQAYGLRADTGAVVWTAPVQNGDWSSPAVTDEGFYVSYSCPVVHKLNPLTGTQVWKYSTGCSGGGGKTPVLYRNRLYVRDLTKYVFDSQTGTQLGTFESRTVPAFDGDMGFFMNAPAYLQSYGTLEGKDLNTNSIVWRFSGDGQLRSAPLVVNDYVYVGSGSGNLYALDPNNGSQVWSANVGASIPYVDEQNVSQPLTGFGAGEGILVVPTDTLLVAYEGDSTAPTLSWGNPAPSPNASGWNNSPVEIPYTTADDFSGVANAAPGSPVRFDMEGASQTQAVNVIDAAGNSANFTSAPVNIDLTTPFTSSTVSGTSNSNGWYREPAQLTLLPFDNLSGVSATNYRIDGGAAQTYTGAFAVSADGAHTVNFWSTDNAGNTESERALTINIDATAPVTRAAASGTTGGDGWYRGAAQISLTATDNASGVFAMHYQIDDGLVQTFTSPFAVADDGTHRVSYWSSDAAGNMETAHVLDVKIDATTPNTFSDVSGTQGNNGWYRGAAQVRLTAADMLSGVAASYYQIDGGATQTYNDGFSITGEGAHTVNFWSTDRAGNTEAQHTLAVNIDTTAPSTKASIANISCSAVAYGWWCSSTPVALQPSDKVSGIAATYYQIDGGAVQTYSGQFVVTGEGAHTVSFWSIDLAGNVEQPRSIPVNIDMTVPITQSAINGTAGGNGWYSNQAQVTLSAFDNLSGIASTSYQIDGGVSQIYSVPFAVSAGGAHTVNFWSTDKAGNVEQRRSLTVRIDSNTPVTTAASNAPLGDDGWYRASVQMTLSATDGQSGVAASYYQIDNGTTQTYAGTFSLNGNGLHTVKFWSVDVAGNAEPARSLQVKIDATPPSVTVTANPSSVRSNKKPLSVTVTGRIADATSGIRPGTSNYNVVDEYGQVQPAGNITLQADGSYSFTIQLTATRNNNDADGRVYTVNVRATDQGGYVGSGSTIVRIQ